MLRGGHQVFQGPNTSGPVIQPLGITVTPVTVLRLQFRGYYRGIPAVQYTTMGDFNF